MAYELEEPVVDACIANLGDDFLTVFFSGSFLKVGAEVDQGQIKINWRYGDRSQCQRVTMWDVGYP